MRIEFQPCPKDDDGNSDVRLATPDGAYWMQSKLGTLVWGLIVVGAMRGSPGEYVDALAAHLGRELLMESIAALQPAPGLTAESAALVRRRGFFLIFASAPEANREGVKLSLSYAQRAA